MFSNFFWGTLNFVISILMFGGSIYSFMVVQNNFLGYISLLSTCFVAHAAVRFWAKAEE